jgi:hypothetical protein
VAANEGSASSIPEAPDKEMGSSTAPCYPYASYNTGVVATKAAHGSLLRAAAAGWWQGASFPDAGGGGGDDDDGRPAFMATEVGVETLFHFLFRRLFEPP